MKILTVLIKIEINKLAHALICFITSSKAVLLCSVNFFILI